MFFVLKKRGIDGIRYLISSVWQVIVFGVKMIIENAGTLGVTDFIYAKVLYGFLTFVFCSLGLYLGKSRQKALAAICSEVVAVISLIFTLASSK